MALLTIAEQQYRVNAQAAWSLGLLDRVCIAGKSLCFYAEKLLWPPNLCFIYPRWNLDAKSFSAWISWLGIAAVIILGWRYRQKSWARAGLFGFAYFAVTLLPVLGFFNVFFFRYSFVADHFQYLASLGIITLVCAAVDKMVHPPVLRLAITSATLVSLAFLSRQHTLVFADEETLWRDTVARNPRAAMAQNNLGLVLYGQLQYRQAIECLDRALQADPDWPEAHYNLGLILTELGYYSEAATQMQYALQIIPAFAKADNGLGVALVQLGQPDAATAHFRHALELDPHYVDARDNLGRILLNAGQLTEAEAEFRRAIQIRPTDFAAHENLGVVLLEQNQLDEAAVEFRKAAQSKSDDPEPHKNMADILMKQQRFPEARQESALAGRLSETHYRIATALLLDNDPDGAIKHFRKSIALLPNNAEAYLALGDALNKEDRLTEAIATLRQGIEVAPNDLRLRNKLARLLVTSPDASIGKGQKPSNSHGGAPGGWAHGAVPE